MRGVPPRHGEPVPHTIERLTVHHSAVPLRDNSDAPGQLRAIQRDHQSQPWTDIAYHYLIDIDGNIYAGRDPAYVGDTFTPYDPTGHFLVCMLGDFDEQPLTRPGLSALVAILAAGAAQYDVDASTIAGHDHYEPSTSCPGRNIDTVINDGSLRTRVESSWPRVLQPSSTSAAPKASSRSLRSSRASRLGGALRRRCADCAAG